MKNKSFFSMGPIWRTRSVASLAILLLALGALVTLTPRSDMAHAGQLFNYLWPSNDLQPVIDGITKRYPKISHISTTKLANMMEKSTDIVLVDVREESEFQVSHLPGAIRISPNANISQINAALENIIKGKKVVFYCSVGERSSRMAELAKDDLMSKGASEVYNLSGGIFAWHNEKRPLRDAKGPTDFVHPFDKHWGRLVKRQDKTRMEPENVP